MNGTAHSEPPPGSEDQWLDDIISTPPAAIPDAGFTARVMTRIRLRRLFRPLVLGGLGLAGALVAVRFTSLEALAALLPGERLARALDALPALDILPAFDALPALGALDYTSPIALTMVAAALLVWLVTETA